MYKHLAMQSACLLQSSTVQGLHQTWFDKSGVCRSCQQDPTGSTGSFAMIGQTLFTACCNRKAEMPDFEMFPTLVATLTLASF